MKRRLFLGLLAALLLVPTGICSPANPNFSGTWKQSNQLSICGMRPNLKHSRPGPGYKTRVPQDVFVVLDGVAFEVGDRAARFFQDAVRRGCVPLHGRPLRG